MSKQEVKTFQDKLNFIEKTFDAVEENRKSISKLDGAIACLQEDRYNAKRPNPPTYEMAYEKELKRLTGKYDEDHTPQKVYMPDNLIWWFVFLTLPFVITCYSYFIEKDAAIGKDVMIFFAIFAIAAIIPIIVFLGYLCAIISYKGRVKRYFKRNRKRLKAIESFKPDAEKAGQRARTEAERKYAEYEARQKANQKIDAQIENYCQKKAELSKTIKDDTATLTALFDELQTPKEYRNAINLIAIMVHFHLDEEAIAAGEMTAMESLQGAYASLRKADEEFEIEQLANRHAARKEKEIREMREKHLAEARAREEAKREKEEKERREREEADKLKRWKELDEWADVVNAQ